MIIINKKVKSGKGEKLRLHHLNCELKNCYSGSKGSSCGLSHLEEKRGPLRSLWNPRLVHWELGIAALDSLCELMEQLANILLLKSTPSHTKYHCWHSLRYYILVSSAVLINSAVA